MISKPIIFVTSGVCLGLYIHDHLISIPLVHDICCWFRRRLWLTKRLLSRKICAAQSSSSWRTDSWLTRIINRLLPLGGSKYSEPTSCPLPSFDPSLIPPPVMTGMLGCVGNTPLVRLPCLSALTGCDILVKLEYQNPGGSSKDRFVLGLLESLDARQGQSDSGPRERLNDSGPRERLDELLQIINPGHIRTFQSSSNTAPPSSNTSNDTSSNTAPPSNDTILPPSNTGPSSSNTFHSSNSTSSGIARSRIRHLFEGTSGSTGISLALLSGLRGYACTIHVPEDTSAEKIRLLRLLGARVIQVAPAPIASSAHFVHASRRAALAAEPPGSALFLNQYDNALNRHIHRERTARELWYQTGGRIDAFVMGAGTGGTLAGIASFLKRRCPSSARLRSLTPIDLNAGNSQLDAIEEQQPCWPVENTAMLTERTCMPHFNASNDIMIVLADPQGSCLANRILHGVAYDHRHAEGHRRRSQSDSLVEGIGLGRLTRNFDALLCGSEEEEAEDAEYCSGQSEYRSTVDAQDSSCLVDAACRVSDAEAKAMARWLLRWEGIWTGGSGAVHLVAAVRTALWLGPGHVVVTMICDHGSRHCSRFWQDS